MDYIELFSVRTRSANTSIKLMTVLSLLIQYIAKFNRVRDLTKGGLATVIYQGRQSPLLYSPPPSPNLGFNAAIKKLNECSYFHT
jgi:hypothetical protein